MTRDTVVTHTVKKSREMLFDIQAEYYSTETIPVRAGNRQEYCMRPLEVRRQQKPGFVLVQDFARSTRAMDRRSFFGHTLPTFADEETRRWFTYRVFLILNLQFAFIILMMFLTTNYTWMSDFMKTYYLLLYIIGAIGGLFYVTLALSKNIRDTYPGNIILTSIVVFCIGYVLASVTVLYDARIILYAFGIQTSIVIFITFLSRFAPCDVAGCAMIFCVLATALCVFSVVASLVWLLTKFSLLQLVLAGIGVQVFTLYMLFNVQLMMDTNIHDLRSSDYVRGNIHLYVDILLVIIMAPKWIYKKLTACCK